MVSIQHADIDHTGLTGAGGSVATDAIFDAKGDLPAGTGANTAAKLTVGADGQVLTAASGQATGLQWATPSSGALTLITDTVLGSDTANFDFTPIAGTYKHLRVILHGRSSRAGNTNDNIMLRFNNDSGNNYDWQISQGFGTSFGGGEGHGVSSIQQIGALPAATSPAGAGGSIVIDVPNYASTTFHKTCSSQCAASFDQSANGMRVWMAAGSWRNTAAITRITLVTANAANFLTGSRCSLYGIS